VLTEKRQKRFILKQGAKGEIKNLDALSKNLVKFVMFGIHGEHKIRSQ
jgi:hypothetical protein